MSLASEIISDAELAIGLSSNILPVTTSITTRAFKSLITLMEGLRKRDIILAETVAGVTTTIVLPTTAADELDEPAAAREHLVNALAVYMIPYSRVPLDSIKIPTLPQSEAMLAKLYRAHVVPSKVPSRLLARGQGHSNRRLNGTFFQGEALDLDVEE